MSEDADVSRFILLYAENSQTPYHNAKSINDLKVAENLVKLWTRPPNKDSYLCMECKVLTKTFPFIWLRPVLALYKYDRNLLN